MPLIRPNINFVWLAAMFAIMFAGCDQQAAYDDDPPPKPKPKPVVSKHGPMAAPGPGGFGGGGGRGTARVKAEPKTLEELGIDELTKLAAENLKNNEVDAAKLALAEARKKSDESSEAKHEIAKLLFGAGEMKASVEVYDEILKFHPDLKPKLWQRGLALYFAEDFAAGVDQFDTHQTDNPQDVENSVWQLLCKSRLTSVEEARKTMIKVDSDNRVPMKQVFNLFAGTGTPEEVIEASGYDPVKLVRSSEKYLAWLYVGLFHEMMGEQEAANAAMKTALKCKADTPGLMGYVADGHLRVRGAYPIETKKRRRSRR